MYVNPNKFFTIFISFIVLTIPNICVAVNSPIQFKVVALSKHKIVIANLDDAKRKVLNIGDITDSGLTLVSATSSAATFKDNNNQLISMGINNEISTTYSNSSSDSDTSNNGDTSSSNSNKSNNAVETIKLNKQNQYITTITINSKDVMAIIDTGANFVTLNSHIADQLGLSYKYGTKINVSTASDNTNGYRVTLKSLKLGSIDLASIDAIIIEGNNPEMTLVGMSFLKNLDLQYSGDRLEIKKHVEKSSTAETPQNKTSTNTTTPIATPPTAASPTVTPPVATSPVVPPVTTSTSPSTPTPTPTSPLTTPNIVPNNTQLPATMPTLTLPATP